MQVVRCGLYNIFHSHPITRLIFFIRKGNIWKGWCCWWIEGIDGIDGIEGIEGIERIDGIEGIDGIEEIEKFKEVEMLEVPIAIGIEMFEVFDNRIRSQTLEREALNFFKPEMLQTIFL